MLLIENKEIDSYLPTSKWRNANDLLSYVEEEEQNVVIPILGESLFNELVSRYEEMVGRYGGVTTNLLPSEHVDEHIRMIRYCQKIQLFMALANNVGLMAVSFNQGGGFNMASSDNYDSADKETLNRLERDAFRKAHRNIETMLYELERDAKKPEPLFAEMWRESDYFYFKAGVLISRADVLNNYLNIGNSRERYIELLPDLRYAQNTYLCPELGSELMQAFVDRNTQVIPMQPKTEASEEEETAGEGGEEPTPQHTPEWLQRQRMLWAKAEDALRASLACYAEYRNVKMRRPESLENAEMSRAQAVKLIRDNQEYFMPYVATSPFYVEPDKEEEKQPENPRCICGEPSRFDPCDPGNAITVLNPTLRRY
ncbi:MAG: DUF6712 family protein [Alloprevotella sp.]